MLPVFQVFLSLNHELVFRVTQLERILILRQWRDFGHIRYYLPDFIHFLEMK